MDGRRRRRTQNGSCRRREMAVPKVPKVPKTCMLTGWGGQGPRERPGCREVCEGCEEVCSPHFGLCACAVMRGGPADPVRSS